MNLTQPQLRRAIFSLWDIQQALSALTFLLQECDFEKNYSTIELRRLRCYESTLIISLARPFEPSRGESTLGLKALGVNLNNSERILLEKVQVLRRKLIAHSDQDEMHYRVSTFSTGHENGKGKEFNFPQFQFVEALLLEHNDLLELEIMLRRLKNEMGKFFFTLAQNHPELMNEYKLPLTLNVPNQA